jgi:hypothetical protein
MSNPSARNAYWLQYFATASIEHQLVDVNRIGDNFRYIVTVNFWDFQQDHFSYIPQQVLNAVRDCRGQIVFWYSEADSPREIRLHIEHLCQLYQLDPNFVVLVSANSQAGREPNCRFFFDDHVLYWHLTEKQPKVDFLDKDPNKLYTCLVRTHKSWRSEFVSNLTRTSPHGLASYHGVENFDPRDDLSVINEPFIRYQSKDIQAAEPDWWRRTRLKADNYTAEEANDHSLVVAAHYRPYINISLETMLDVGEDAVFVTEKTMKPLRNGQILMVVGCAGTLDFLRSFGYKTFSPYIDESYDTETDVRLRWYKVLDQIRKIHNRGPDYWNDLWHRCLPAIIHNQVIFNRGLHDYTRHFFQTL